MLHGAAVLGLAADDTRPATVLKSLESAVLPQGSSINGDARLAQRPRQRLQRFQVLSVEEVLRLRFRRGAAAAAAAVRRCARHRCAAGGRSDCAARGQQVCQAAPQAWRRRRPPRRLVGPGERGPAVVELVFRRNGTAAEMDWQAMMHNSCRKCLCSQEGELISSLTR